MTRKHQKGSAEQTLRKVALHGSYFGYNFGDTLLCALFCNWIRSVSDVEVVLPLASRRNMELIGADRRGIRAFMSCPELVFCGGGYFGGPANKSLKWAIRNFFRHFVVAEIAMLMKKKIYILGTGVGPVPTVFLRRRLKKLADYAERVVVRDDESLAFLESLGVSRQVDVDVDAVMYMDRDFFDSGSSADAPAEQPPGQALVIHLTNFDAAYWEEMAQVVAELCRAEPDINPILLTDSRSRTGRSTAQDKSSCRLKQLVPRATQFHYDGDPMKLCRLLDTADLVVTNKLHVGIVSVVLGKHVISVPQHAKTPRFYRQLGMSDVCITEDQAQRLGVLLAEWREGRLSRAVLPSRQNVYADTLIPIGVAG